MNYFDFSFIYLYFLYFLIVKKYFRTENNILNRLFSKRVPRTYSGLDKPFTLASYSAARLSKISTHVPERQKRAPFRFGPSCLIGKSLITTDTDNLTGNDKRNKLP